MLSRIFKRLEIDLIDKKIFAIFFSLLLIGGTTFFSAALGVLNRNELKFHSIVESQVMAYGVGLVLLILGFLIASNFYYKISPIIYSLSIFLSLLVFIPGIGMKFGGSTRWINYTGISFQPGEILKIGIVLVTAWFFTKYKDYLHEIKYLLIYFFAVMAPASIIMFLQKDFGTLIILYAICICILFISNIKFIYSFGTLFLIMIFISFYIYNNDYVKNRILDYNNSSKSEQGISYQNKQALIAIGNGGLFGRGIGQSVQKFYYLPEPAGDSVFAVYLEEYGFIGGVIVLVLFLTLLLIILNKSISLDNLYGKYVLIGIVMLFFMQNILNIGSMINLIPISGDTLPFFSQGGSALICNLFVMGFVLQLTKNKDLIV